MPATVPIQYGDLFEFLEDYRASFSHLQYRLPASGMTPGDDVALAVSVPVLQEVITLYGQVGDGDDQAVGVHINPEAGDGMSRLEGFYRFVGQVVESMLVSGRFQVTGQWAAGGAAPQPAKSAVAVTDAARSGTALLTGTVDETSMTLLLMELYRSKARGILEITSDAGRRIAHIDKGGIVQWASDPIIQDECLGVLLAKAKKIDHEQLRTSLELMNSTGQQQGQCFIDMGVLTFPQLVVSLMTQVELITRGLMRTSEGTYAFHPQETMEKSFVTPPMKAAAFLFSYYRKRFANVSSAELDAKVADYMDRYTVLVKDVPLADMKLQKAEQRFLTIVGERSYRFREIFTVSNLGRAVTLQALLTLIELDMLQFVEGEDSEQRLEGLRKQLETKLNNMTGASPFDILETHWTSLDRHVKEAYEARAGEWSRFGRGLTLPPDLEDMRAKILGTLKGAFDAIGEQKKRVLVRKEYYEDQQHDFSADLLFKQGEMLMVRGRWDDVIDAFEKASELMPRDANYKQMLAVARGKKASS